MYKLLALCLIVISFSAAWLWMDYNNFTEQPIHIAQTQEAFEIRPGSSIKTVARQLQQRGIISSARYFIWLARLTGQAQSIKAGEYTLTAGMPQQLLDQFIAGKTRQYLLTVIEGWGVRELLQAIAHSTDIDHHLSDVTPQNVMQMLNLPGHPEGQFYPDTYYFPKGSTDTDFLTRAYEKMQAVLQQEWQNREPDLPLKTPYEALILASIVEKETGLPEEREQVAGVFINRLRKGMKLQTDPTVIYGMGDRYRGNIRRRDLREDTPYNTYVHHGLPPTPIALPSQAAIHASLHPSKHAFIYFVATGQGGHTFTRTLKEHNRAVRVYLKRTR